MKKLTNFLNSALEIADEVSPYSVGITHTGVFHADDVFSAALLNIVSPGIEIKRVSRVPDDLTDDTFVFDIGGGQFDHHQEGAEVRKNKIPYAAFGLLWREFGHALCGDAADDFDRCFVQPLDHADNGGPIDPMTMAISSFMPNWDDADQDKDAAFFRAVDFAQGVLTRQICRINAAEAAKSIVDTAASNARGNIAVLDRFVPWDTVLPDTHIAFVVFPSLRGGWTAQAVPTTPGGRDQKNPFPASDILTANVSGITFCHTGRFMISAETQEAAIKACEFASKQ